MKRNFLLLWQFILLVSFLQIQNCTKAASSQQRGATPQGDFDPNSDGSAMGTGGGSDGNSGYNQKSPSVGGTKPGGSATGAASSAGGGTNSGPQPAIPPDPNQHAATPQNCGTDSSDPNCSNSNVGNRAGLNSTGQLTDCGALPTDFTSNPRAYLTYMLCDLTNVKNDTSTWRMIPTIYNLKYDALSLMVEIQADLDNFSNLANPVATIDDGTSTSLNVRWHTATSKYNQVLQGASPNQNLPKCFPWPYIYPLSATSNTCCVVPSFGLTACPDKTARNNMPNQCTLLDNTADQVNNPRCMDMILPFVNPANPTSVVANVGKANWAIPAAQWGYLYSADFKYRAFAQNDPGTNIIHLGIEKLSNNRVAMSGFGFSPPAAASNRKSVFSIASRYYTEGANAYVRLLTDVNSLFLPADSNSFTFKCRYKLGDSGFADQCHSGFFLSGDTTNTTYQKEAMFELYPLCSGGPTAPVGTPTDANDVCSGTQGMAFALGFASAGSSDYANIASGKVRVLRTDVVANSGNSRSVQNTVGNWVNTAVHNTYDNWAADTQNDNVNAASNPGSFFDYYTIPNTRPGFYLSRTLQNMDRTTLCAGAGGIAPSQVTDYCHRALGDDWSYTCGGGNCNDYADGCGSSGLVQYRCIRNAWGTGGGFGVFEDIDPASLGGTPLPYAWVFVPIPDSDAIVANLPAFPAFN